MAKTSTASTIAVGELITGAGIFLEDVRAVIEQINWSHGERICEALIGDSVLDTLSASSGWETARQTRIWIDPDATTLELASVAALTAANTCGVRFTVGAASAVTNSHTNPTNNTVVVGTVAVSSTGTGWRDVTIEINHTAGSATSDTVTFLGIQVQRIDASAMPDPSG
jgi:hypothetical protein